MRIPRIIHFLPLLLAVLATATPQAAGVRLNEIMYHPASTNVLEEWIELYNSDTASANISGWKITKGVSFTFPTNATIAPGAFLVVAAHLPTFSQIHPAVSNVVGGWQGSLSNDGEEIQLEDAVGAVIENISYAPEGDWAVRRLSAPDQYNRQGWEWFAPHDGLGSSLELINVNLSSDRGQNWAASLVQGGTPGAANSTASANIPPMIVNVTHSPIIPTSSDAVTISARLIDEQTSGLSLQLSWRLDAAASFTNQTMFDDGAHGDGLPNDRLYAVRLPAQSDGAIIEYYLTAADSSGLTRVYPNVIPSGNSRTANLLYQVDNELYSGRAPLFRLIMSKAEYDYLKTIWNGAPDSDAEVNGTFIATDGIITDGAATRLTQNASFRNRGHGSRASTPHNFHVGIPKDRLWQGRDAINLNTQSTPSQLLGSELARRAGLIMPESRAVLVRVNSADLANAGAPQFGHYVANESYGEALLERQLPSDPNGNLYRGYRDAYRLNPGAADLSYKGTNYTAYTNAYFKETHKDLNDYSDIISLTAGLTNTLDADYLEAVATHVNVPLWMRYFAINTLWDNQETALGTGSGDDYGLYQGVLDPRFILLPYDVDSILGGGSRTNSYADGIFRINALPTVSRFMKHPNFAPLYYSELKTLADTLFSPAQLNPLLDQLIPQFTPAPQLQAAVENLRAFNLSHRAYVLSNIPMNLTVTTALTNVSGFPHTTNASINLSGRANAIRTREVLVNGVPATWTAWTAMWSATNIHLNPGLNRILIESFDAASDPFDQLTYVVWFDDNSVQNVSGAIAASASWTPEAGPYRITSSVTVANGATLTIQAGTTIYLAAGVSFNVAAGGRLLAEGTENSPLLFTRAPGLSNTWSGLNINGEAAIRFAHFEFNSAAAIHCNGATVDLEALTFGATGQPYISLDASSFIVRDCVFPPTSALFEPLHGTGGIKAGGHGIFVHNFFGAAQGYNDVVDFTGGQRPGPIVHFIDNVFTGTGDDILDLDGTDAWVEGNLFLHAHKNGSVDSSSAVSGGDDSTRTSEVTIIGNIFYDQDQAATAKQGNYYKLFDNTIVHQTKAGGLDTDAGVINLADEGTTEGAGMLLDSNIIFDFEKLIRNQTAAIVTLTNNFTGDPLFRRIPAIGETVFTNWAGAQILREWLQPLAASNARNLGARLFATGIAIAGPPASVRTNAATFAFGPGYTHYKWRLNGGPWSDEIERSIPLQLSNLPPGAQTLEAIGKRDSGLYQDDPLFAPSNPISSYRWTIEFPFPFPNSQIKTVVINELLAKNIATFILGGAAPDLIELRNTTASPIDLGGCGLSDDLANLSKYRFPTNTILAPGEYRTIFADTDTSSPGLHIGFSLDQDGEALFLTDKNGAFLDAITFGAQIPDYSLGRRADDTWGLCQPTFGAPNIPVSIGDPRALKINEWLANARFISTDDFVEIFNPTPLPIALWGLFISDAPGLPTRHQFAQHSFVPAHGLLSFRADGQANKPGHLNFKLAAETGTINLSTGQFPPIDFINYGPQQTDVSQGRSPSGADTLAYFETPTPGALNPSLPSTTNTIATPIINELLVRTQTLPTPWIELFNPSTNTIDASDLSLSDSAANPRKWILAAGSSIQPNAYLTINLTNLAWNGGSVYLFDSIAKGGGLLDAITYGIQTPDFAIGRAPNWTLTIPTRSAPNTAAGLGSPAALRLNEWMADPAAGPDWFEIFNSDSVPISLANLSFTDELDEPRKSPIAPLSYIGAGRNGYVQIFADRALAAGADHVDFRLSRASSSLGIFAPSGLQIDALQFGAQQPNTTQGRLPDGFGPFAFFPSAATPAAPNQTIPTPADTDGDGLPDAYEDAHSLNKFANDALLDLDHDGLNNYAEYLAGTDPQNPASSLTLAIDPSLHLTFPGLQDKTYAIQTRPDLTTGHWEEIHRQGPLPANTTITLSLQPPAPDPTPHFYRLVLIP